MGKQTVLSHLKNNHFDTKGSGAFENAAESPNNFFQLQLSITQTRPKTGV